MNQPLALTPTTFVGAFTDGLAEMEGLGFEWRGHKFVAHSQRPGYRTTLEPEFTVSHADTGMSVWRPNPAKWHEGQTAARAARHAIAKLDKAGEATLLAAIHRGMELRPKHKAPAGMAPI